MIKEQTKIRETCDLHVNILLLFNVISIFVWVKKNQNLKSKRYKAFEGNNCQIIGN